MLTLQHILETNRMITENKLDVRTITLGISLRDCAHPDTDIFCRNIYDKNHAKQRRNWCAPVKISRLSMAFRLSINAYR